MKDLQLLNVNKAKSFDEVWKSLETLYERKNAASLLFLLAAAILYHQDERRR